MAPNHQLLQVLDRGQGRRFNQKMKPVTNPIQCSSFVSPCLKPEIPTPDQLISTTTV
jgi:hypothetical protein